MDTPTEGSATVSHDDLLKSIAALESLLDSDDVAESMEKGHQIGTDGGLQGETPSDGNINVDMAPDEQEVEDVDEAAAADQSEAEKNAPSISVAGGGTFKKALGAADDDESFAKSLSAAFAGQDEIIDVARGSDFAKALVTASIEGLSIAHDEIQKSLAASETRSQARIESLEKSLATLMKGMGELMKEVRGVSNSPVRPVAKSAQVLHKGFAGQPVGSQGMTLSKAQICESLERRVMAGKLDALTLSKYESAGEIDPALLAEIQNGSAY